MPASPGRSKTPVTETDVEGAGGEGAREKVIFVQDGSVDDYMGFVVLAEMHKKGAIDLLGEIMLNGDSVLPYSMEVGYKLHRVMELEHIPLTLSKARMFNPFPWEYRRDTMYLSLIEELQAVQCELPETFADGDAWLECTLRDATCASITYVCTAPLTNLADVLRRQPSLEAGLKEVVWMAGAIDVGGNLDPSQYPGWNKKAEWNVYADPGAASWVFEKTHVPIKLFPLDICDQVPIKGHFMDKIKELAGMEGKKKALNKIIHRAYEEICAPQPFYRLWDTVAAGYIARPDLFAPPQEMQLTVVESHEFQGWTARQGQAEARYFRPVKVFKEFASQACLHSFIHMVATHEF